MPKGENVIPDKLEGHSKEELKKISEDVYSEDEDEAESKEPQPRVNEKVQMINQTITEAKGSDKGRIE